MSTDDLYTEPPKQIKGRSFWGAYLLCYFFGYFGAHRFYTGRIGSAVTQLILTLTGFGAVISCIWVLIDYIRICIGNFTDYEDDPLEGYPGCAVVILSTIGIAIAVGILTSILSILFFGIKG